MDRVLLYHLMAIFAHHHQLFSSRRIWRRFDGCIPAKEVRLDSYNIPRRRGGDNRRRRAIIEPNLDEEGGQFNDGMAMIWRGGDDLIFRRCKGAGAELARWRRQMGCSRGRDGAGLDGKALFRLH